MNDVAERLVQSATGRFGREQFAIEPNDRDPEADPGSVVLTFPHPRRPERHLSVDQRGNTFEVRYSDGSSARAAEKLFIFRDVTELSGAIEEALEFVDRVFSGEIVAYRQRPGRVSRSIWGGNQASHLYFVSRDKVATLRADSLDAICDWNSD